MHIKRLCFVFPDDGETEPVDHEKVRPKSSHRRCGGHFLGFLKESLHRFLDSRWVTFCSQEVAGKMQFSGQFHDTEGVQMGENKVGSDNPRIFSYSELFVGSNGFSENEILGSGGFGKVYRAVLPSDGTVVAVKCLAEKGERFEKTFAAELVAVAHLRHRNLVRLRGWCVHDNQLFLVYDYMPNRSLDKVLFKRTENLGQPFLDWERRKKIVHGLAAALFYLHEQLETQIIHRDVKTSNVMLDSGFNARLGDFGLARWLEHELEYQTRTPPESFQKRGVATAKSDVFSFGIVVLEVASGRRAVDLTCPDDQTILLDWIRRLSDEGMLLQCGDSRLMDGSYKLAEMERLIHIGLLCTLHEPHSRPNMKWVVEALYGEIYGKLPGLPSFRSHPLYISLSSSSNSATSHTMSTRTTVSSSSTIAAFHSENFVTASGETVYMSAESGNSSVSCNSSSKIYSNTANQTSGFPIVDTPREFTFKEIIAATNNFSDSRRVAEVDFGTAYQGFLDNHQQILVKRLGMKTCPALRVRFCTELQNLGRLRHRNLVQLRGWCTEQGEMLVVYDYSANHLLSHLLFHHKPSERHTALKWRHRYNIIKSLASAIRYLHEEWDEQVIHRCITSSAIILDPDMNPRLGSFALAEFLARNEHGHHVVVDKNKSVRGIFGYMSPEYMESGEATTMADVYSFGVVLLEVVSGQMAVDFRRPEVLLVHRLHEFELRKRPYEELADLRLDGEINKRELIRMVRLGMACTRSDPVQRPSMRQIVSILDGRDQWFMENGLRKERREEWRKRNASSLSHVRRIQALGIH